MPLSLSLSLLLRDNASPYPAGTCESRDTCAASHGRTSQSSRNDDYRHALSRIGPSSRFLGRPDAVTLAACARTRMGNEVLPRRSWTKRVHHLCAPILCNSRFLLVLLDTTVKAAEASGSENSKSDSETQLEWLDIRPGEAMNSNIEKSRRNASTVNLKVKNKRVLKFKCRRENLFSGIWKSRLYLYVKRDSKKKRVFAIYVFKNSVK